MKVQCDVCETAHATVLCCADEASLCAECDTRVHAANKLASKHQRVPLLYPSPEDLPCCDICQEKTGYFFCLEDRALLCRNCDYSIHSTNALAANHKRFLVSGLRVGLQAIMTCDTSESTQACSPSQVSSPTTQGSQLSSPMAQVSQLNSAGNVRSQKLARSTPLLSKTTCLVPQESSSVMMGVIIEEASSKVPSLPPPAPKQEQQQQSQQMMLTLSQENSQHTAPTGVFHSKVVGVSSMSLPSPSITQQTHINMGKPLSDWDMHSDMNHNPHGLNKGEFLTQRVGGSLRRSSISEYLTESIPGWRVDELLNLPDMDAIYNFADAGISKMDASTSDADWPTECSASDSEGLGEAVAAEVPSMPSPPTSSGVPKLSRPWGFGKPLKEPDLDFFLHCDEPLVVPDIGGVSSPTNLSSSSLPQKRRRSFFEF